MSTFRRGHEGSVDKKIGSDEKRIAKRQGYDARQD